MHAEVIGAKKRSAIAVFLNTTRNKRALVNPGDGKNNVYSYKKARSLNALENNWTITFNLERYRFTQNLYSIINI